MDCLYCMQMHTYSMRCGSRVLRINVTDMLCATASESLIHDFDLADLDQYSLLGPVSDDEPHYYCEAMRTRRMESMRDHGL